MVLERATLRAVTRTRASKPSIVMPWSPSSSRSIQTSCAALTTKSRQNDVANRRTYDASASRRIATRYASTASNRPDTPSLKADPSASSLTWNEFLQLRKVRRRYNLVASILTGVNSALGGAAYLSTMDLTQIGQLLFGIDPFMALGITTAGCGALGWLMGPFAGNAVFNLMHSKTKNDIMVKEKDFFHRIQRNRADITAGGNLQANPFPDYYGEKIDSVKGYRQWLRDQKKFSKKRQYQDTADQSK